MLEPRSITSMFNYPRVRQCWVFLNYLQWYFFCFSCAAWNMMWQPLEQMVATTRGKLRFSIREEMVNSETVALTPTDLQFCRQFHKASPQIGGKICWNLLDFVKACFASPGHGWCWNLDGRRQWECQFCHVIPLFPARFLDPRSVYIASSIILMNYSHFSVRCHYPFASRSWSTALKPWRWVVVWRGRLLSLNLPVWLGRSITMPVRHWRCPDPRKWLDSTMKLNVLQVHGNSVLLEFDLDPVKDDRARPRLDRGRATTPTRVVGPRSHVLQW